MTNNNNSNQKERSYRWVWWLIGLLLVVGLIVWYQTRPPEVTVADARIGDLSVIITASGDVEGMVAEISPSVQGQVEAIYRHEGDRVRRGDILARISGGPSMAQSPTAQINYETVEAPFDGIISRRYADPGDSVGPGQAVYQVADTSDIWVTALIDDIDVGKIHTGQNVEIVLPSYLGEGLPGRIERIAATATPRTQEGVGGKVVRTRVELTKGTGPLRPGMEVDVSAESTIARDVLLVPADAVLEDETGRWVLKVVGGHVERQPIVLGANNYVEAQVLEGLEVGDTVVVDGKEDVKPGDEVRTISRGERE